MSHWNQDEMRELDQRISVKHKTCILLHGIMSHKICTQISWILDQSWRWKLLLYIYMAISHLWCISKITDIGFSALHRTLTIHIDSHHKSSMFVRSQLIRQMCFHLPNCTFTLFPHKSKTTSSQRANIWFLSLLIYSPQILSCPSPFPHAIPKNVHKNK